LIERSYRAPAVLRGRNRRRRRSSGRGAGAEEEREDGHRWTPVGFRELTGHVNPRRKFDAGHPRSLWRSPTRRSLISILREPVERWNSKKRDGWRHCERLRIVTVPDPQSAFSCWGRFRRSCCRLSIHYSRSPFFGQRMTRNASSALRQSSSTSSTVALGARETASSTTTLSFNVFLE